MKVEKTAVLSSIPSRKKVGDELALGFAHARMHGNGHGGVMDGGVVGGIRLVAEFLAGGEVRLIPQKQRGVGDPWVSHGQGLLLTCDEVGELWAAVGEGWR